MIESVLTIVNVIVNVFIFSMISFIISLIILKVFTKIDFENALYDNKSRNKNDIPNHLAMRFICTVFSSVFFLTGLIVLGTYFAV